MRDLARRPINLSVDWISKTVTTDPPKLMAHDEVQLSFGWRRISLTDARLKIDPREQTTVLAPSQAETGQIIPVWKLRNHPVTAAVFTVAADDTEARRRHRWRVLPELTTALPTDLVALTSGHQSGTATADKGQPTPHTL